jgi:hypothetical protein
MRNYLSISNMYGIPKIGTRFIYDIHEINKDKSLDVYILLHNLSEPIIGKAIKLFVPGNGHEGETIYVLDKSNQK